jgi:hypothetical protein
MGARVASTLHLVYFRSAPSAHSHSHRQPATLAYYQTCTHSRIRTRTHSEKTLETRLVTRARKTDSCFSPSVTPLHPMPRFDSPGPYEDLVELKGIVETHRPAGEAGGTPRLSRLAVVATLPATATPTSSAAPVPIVAFLGGFQSRASFYRPLARRLASHGFAVLQYTSPLLQIVPDAHELPFLGAACGWLRGALNQQQQEPAGAATAPVPLPLDWERAAVMGHSRGGKLAALHFARGFGVGAGGAEAAAGAAQTPRFRACFLVDPVDNTPFTPESALYPSAVRAIRDLGARFAPGSVPHPPPPPPLVPPPTSTTPVACAAAPPAPPPPPQPKVGIIAAGIIGPSNPAGSNWRLFARAADEALPGSRTLVLPDAGHTSFFSAPPGGALGATLIDAMFGGGKCTRESVLDRTAAAAVAWLDAEVGRQGGRGEGGGGDAGKEAGAREASWLERLVAEGRAEVYAREKEAAATVTAT